MDQKQRMMLLAVDRLLDLPYTLLSLFTETCGFEQTEREKELTVCTHALTTIIFESLDELRGDAETPEEVGYHPELIELARKDVKELLDHPTRERMEDLGKKLKAVIKAIKNKPTLH